MEKNNRISVNEELSKFDFTVGNNNDYIEVTQWSNGEGYDITITRNNTEKTFSLTDGEIDAIKCLTDIIKFDVINKKSNE